MDDQRGAVCYQRAGAAARVTTWRALLVREGLSVTRGPLGVVVSATTYSPLVSIR